MHSSRSGHNETEMSDPINFTEEFNDRILCPELSDSEKMMLHEEVKKIYETYCLDESVDKIRFDPFIVEEIRNSMWQGSSQKYIITYCSHITSMYAINIYCFLVFLPSCRGPISRGGEIADHEVFVWSLWTCPVSPGECFYPDVLSQWWSKCLRKETNPLTLCHTALQHMPEASAQFMNFLFHINIASVSHAVVSKCSSI